MRRRQFLRMASAAAGAGLLTRSGPAWAQTLAGKQIRMVVPFPAGGQPTSWPGLSLKCWRKRLKRLSWSITAAAQAARLGADAVAKSAPDGQTLLMATVGTHAINPALYRNLSYDAENDFTPVARRSAASWRLWA
jgi:tripartite-type tricarboxylate transporter receptor subunit TctC